MSNDIVLRDYDVLNPLINISDRVELAENVATTLKTILTQQKLIQKIKGNEYVTVSGWNTLGTMLGVRVIVDEVVPFPTNAKYGYKARVSLYQSDNHLATGEAIATSNGFQKEEHTVYSMAITRAEGKAFRMCMSWIVELAGYKATPYEEMPEEMIKKTSNDSFTTADNVTNTELDPVALNYCRSIRDVLESEGKPVTKSKMRSKLVKMIKDGDIDKSLRPQLIDFINEHCPEELE